MRMSSPTGTSSEVLTTARIDAIREVIREQDADAALLTFLPDICWACGFSGSNGILIVTQGEAHFVTDGRYTVQARREVVGARVHVPGYQLLEHVQAEGLLNGAQTILFQADHVTVSQRSDLVAQFAPRELKPVSDLLTTRIGSKDEDEIERIRAAQRVTDDVFEYLLGIIRPGVTEREIGAEIVYQHLRRGADAMSFTPIVASGANGALPHARPSDKPVAVGDMVVLDFGCFLNGYASDMTRTVAVGEPGGEAKSLYALVLEAQTRAIDAAQAGMTSIELDSVAREVINAGGYGAYFTHGLGHGLGLQIHEWPRVSYHVDHVLPERAVVTIEPGVYLPDRFGVRIEDIVVLRESGCDDLTGARKDLVVL